MRNNTQKIYERLSKGEFLSVDSIDISTRHLFNDIEENLYLLKEMLENMMSSFRECGNFNCGEE